MTNQTIHPGPAEAVVDDCWNRIGVKGDRSCPRLPAAIHCRNCAVFEAAGQRLFDRPPPEDHVRRQTRQIAPAVEETAATTIPVVVFRLGQEWLALDVAFATEIAEPRVIRRVPHRSDRSFLGLSNVRGELLLCIALDELLGIERAPRETDAGEAARSAERWIVVEHDRQSWVFVADEVAGVVRVAEQRIANVPVTVSRRHSHVSRGVFTYDNRRVGYLAADRVFQALSEMMR